VIKLHATGILPASGTTDQVRAIEAAELDGVFVSDHLFVSHGKPRRDAAAGGDPFVKLGAAAALSDRLILATLVVNIGLIHPALAARGFLELAKLAGGERVFAGIGGGWNREEFEALGMAFPPFAERMDRLEEAAALTRALFDEGYVELQGEHAQALGVRLDAPPGPPPRLLLGGGSDRLLEIAGRHADVVDLNGSSRRLKLGGAHPALKDPVRRLTTTVADLDDSVQQVRHSAVAAGRDADLIEFSVLVSAIRFCSQAEIETVERELCAGAGMEPQSLADCPYVFVGPPERMVEQLAERAERLRLRHLILRPFEHDVFVRFREDVARVATG
jgi:alkanesulfonate monooxygenase SsuD/methylene tetrahydromethanopterin reductase-like flavin-dependent oxidoreductase (luciferase family)